MRAWVAHQYGRPNEVLTLEEDWPGPASPGPDDVLVRVQATTLNFNDIDATAGQYTSIRPPVPFIPGMEVLGVVEDAGANARDWIGKRVVTIPNGAHGAYAEYAVATQHTTFEMPHDMPQADAAAIFFPFHLSHLALYERGKLQAGETVLIHAGAGGAGSAAIQLAKARGAKVITTAGSEEKLEFCRQLGADVAVNYRDPDWTQQVVAATDDEGVDVAFDAIGGDTTLATFKCMGFGGRHLIIGFASGIAGEDVGIPPRPWVYANFSLIGVCHAYTPDPKAFRRATGLNFPSTEDGRHTHAELLQMFEAGTIRTVVGAELPFEELPAGMEKMAGRGTVGRTVVHVSAP
jgi:NADPH2:quinone reductase